MRYHPIVTILYALAPLVVPTTLGCGDGSPTVAGIVDVKVHQSGMPDSSPTPWFGGTAIPLDAPPGRGQGFFGTCTHAGSTWTADIHLAGTFTAAIHAMKLILPEDLVAPGSIVITLDQGSFTGSCTGARSRWSDGHDLQFAGNCPGLTLPMDPRTADAGLTMTLSNCTGQ